MFSKHILKRRVVEEVEEDGSLQNLASEFGKQGSSSTGNGTSGLAMDGNDQLGRRSAMPKELLNGTLGCSDIMLEILSNFTDEELFENLINYCKTFPDLVKSCNSVLKQRRVLYCNNRQHMDFLSECLQNEPFVNAELVLAISDYPPSFVSIVEKFQTVHLSRTSIPKRALVDLMTASTSKIQHLKFTTSRAVNSLERRFWNRKLKLSPHLKKLTFNNGDYANPINEISTRLDLNSSNIEELAFLSSMTQSDFYLLETLGHKLTKLNLSENKLPRNFKPCPLLDTLHLYWLPQWLIPTSTLIVKYPGNLVFKSDLRCEVVKKIVLEKGVTGFLRPFLCNVLNSFPRCEELVIPECYLENVAKDVLQLGETPQSLKKIIIKYSKLTKPYHVGALKYELQSLFSSEVVVECEEIQKNEEFQTLSRKIVEDCFELLYKRIERDEKVFISMEDSRLFEQISKIKKEFYSAFLSKSYSKLSVIETLLDTLEGLKDNKKNMLETIRQSIKNYHDIFGDDSLFMSISKKIDSCFATMEDEPMSEIQFSKHYGEVESLFHKVVRVIEESGFPSKVLFTEQWFDEEIVEHYDYQDGEEQFYEDSQEEMEKASNEIEEEEEGDEEEEESE